MKFKYSFVLESKKLEEIASEVDYLHEQSVMASAEHALKNNSKARYAEVYQYRYFRGFMKDRALIARFTKSDDGSISYIGY